MKTIIAPSDLCIGDRFNCWTVIGSAAPYRWGRQVLCRCECGTERVVNAKCLSRCRLRSCGCKRSLPHPRYFLADRETAQRIEHPETACEHCGELCRWGGRSKEPICRSCANLGNSATHGMKHSPEYRIWGNMKHRCKTGEDKGHNGYGNRGISVCPEWEASFEAFYADMGPRPSPEHSVDRIDNDGPYSPENCRWATAAEQARNTRTNHYILYQGENLTLEDWANRLGVHPSRILRRLKQGRSLEQALAPSPKIRPCSEPGCELNGQVKGMCRRHYCTARARARNP